MRLSGGTRWQRLHLADKGEEKFERMVGDRVWVVVARCKDANADPVHPHHVDPRMHNVENAAVRQAEAEGFERLLVQQVIEFFGLRHDAPPEKGLRNKGLPR